MSGWKIWGLRLGLGLLGALLLGLPFRYLALGPLVYIGMVPWVILWTHPKLGERGVVPVMALSSFLWYWLAIRLFFSFGPAVGWICMFLSLVHFIVPSLVVRRCYRRLRLPLTLLLPVVYTGWEILRPHFLPGDWGLEFLGHSQIGYIQMVQVADLFGAQGISFLLAAGNGAVADLIYAGLWRQEAWSRSRARVLLAAAAFPVLLAAVWAYGVHRLGQDTFREGPRLALIQSAVPHKCNDTDATREASAAQADQTIEGVPRGAADLVIWPENAVCDFLDKHPQYAWDIRRVLAATDAELLLSAFRRVPDDPTGEHGYSSVFHFGPDGLRLVYDKVHLIPLTEYMPYERTIRDISPWLFEKYRAFAKWLIGWAAASLEGEGGVKVFTLETDRGTWTFGAPTCYENTTTFVPRMAVRNGAEFLVNMTSEGHLGPEISRELYLMSAFRAIEHRVGVVRVGNVGITGFIDPLGRPQAILSDPRGGPLMYRKGVLIERVMLDDRTGTLYTFWGDWPAYALSLLSGLLLLTTRARGPHRRRDPEPEEQETLGGSGEAGD